MCMRVHSLCMYVYVWPDSPSVDQVLIYCNCSLVATIVLQYIVNKLEHLFILVW